MCRVPVLVLVLLMLMLMPRLATCHDAHNGLQEGRGEGEGEGAMKKRHDSYCRRHDSHKGSQNHRWKGREGLHDLAFGQRETKGAPLSSSSSSSSSSSPPPPSHSRVLKERDELEKGVLHFMANLSAGSRRGHLIPGVMWIAWSAWWYLHLVVYWIRRRSTGSAGHDMTKPVYGKGRMQVGILSPIKRFITFKHCHENPFSQPWFRGLFCRSELVEPCTKAVLPLVGIFLELYFHYPQEVCYRWFIYDGSFDRETANVWLHTALYSGILFSGLVDLLVHFRYLPKRFDKLVHVLVFANQGMLFAVHLAGSNLSIMMHKILVGLTFAYVAMAIFDFYVANDFTVAVMRPFFLCMMGTWIIQTGVTLFPQNSDTQRVGEKDLAWFKLWQMDTHLSMMVVPIFLSFYALVVMCSMIAIFWILCYLMIGGSWRRVLMRDHLEQTT